MKDLCLSLWACCSDASPVLVCHFMSAARPFSASQKSTKASSYRWKYISACLVILCLNYTDTPWLAALPMLHAADDTLPCPRYKNCEWKIVLPKQKLPPRSHQDYAREILTEPTSTKWKPSLHETLLSGQRWLSPVFSFRRRDCNQKGGETREEGREGGRDGRKRRGTFPPLTEIYSVAVLFTSLVALLWESGRDQLLRNVFSFLMSCYWRTANFSAVRQLLLLL